MAQSCLVLESVPQSWKKKARVRTKGRCPAHTCPSPPPGLAPQNGSKAPQSPLLSPCSALYHGLALKTTPGLHLATALASEPRSAVQITLPVLPNSVKTTKLFRVIWGGGASRHSVIAAGDKMAARRLTRPCSTGELCHFSLRFHLYFYLCACLSVCMHVCQKKVSKIYWQL